MPDLRPSLLATVGKLLQRLRTRGVGEVWPLAQERLKKGWGSQDRLTFLVHAAGGEEPTDPEDLEFRAATPMDGVLYARDIGTDSAATFAGRLSDKTECWLVLRDGKIAHASWTTRAAAWTREVHRYFKPPPGDAYVYESFTSPDVRGRGIYPLALQHILARLGGAGTNRVWVGVEVDNHASVKAITKAGFEPGFDVVYRRRFFRMTVDPPTGPLASEGDFLVSRP